MAMPRRPFARVLAFVLAAGMLAIPLSASAREGRQPRRTVTLDAVFAAYLSGDSDVVSRTFTTSLDFQAARLGEPRRLDRWLGAWHQGKAVLVLELADAATVVAPQFVRPLLGAGRRYVEAAHAAGAPDDFDKSFVRLWRRAAIGLLQRSGAPFMVEEHLHGFAAPDGSNGAGDPGDARAPLARAIAQERRCWDVRPHLARAGARIRDLTRAAGMEVRGPGEPNASALAAEDARWKACLGEAIARFEAAAAVAETRAEARVRGGWLLFQQGHPQAALEWLDEAQPGDDRDVVYWASLIRGRVLDELGRHEAAAEAYAAALAVCPDAQSAGVGLALALFRIDRVIEADEVARSLRTRTAAVADPWWHYPGADQRFVDGWIAELRAAIR
jgi:tetratricopeptide (TPR) repeat protein